jgi:hypothetical protein
MAASFLMCPVCYFGARARVHRRAAWASVGMEPST